MRSDLPRYPRPLAPRSPKLDGVEKATVGCGCAVILAHLAFWSLVIFVAYHFITKYW